MSWQATAWATKRETGSPARKLLLLVIANYANEFGICWPSQETLSADTEQSIDTVQRHAKRLMQDGHLSIAKRARSGGRWPKLIYRLNMPQTEPQNAVRQESNTYDQEPFAARPGRNGDGSPGRNGHPSPCRKAVRHEPSKRTSKDNIQSEPSPTHPRSSLLPREGSGEVGSLTISEIIDRVVARLGRGDAGKGWDAYKALPHEVRQDLRNQERAGTLDDALVDALLMSRSLSNEPQQ